MPEMIRDYPQGVSTTYWIWTWTRLRQRVNEQAWRSPPKRQREVSSWIVCIGSTILHSKDDLLTEVGLQRHNGREALTL